MGIHVVFSVTVVMVTANQNGAGNNKSGGWRKGSQVQWT
jgi:hypothetical protein